VSIAVGIDLGTTNSVVAAVRDGLAFTVTDSAGRRLIPSVVSFHPSGNVLVAQQALERRLTDPENTVYSIKRLIGRPWPSEEVQAAAKRFAFKLKEGPKQGVMLVARDEEYSLPEISAFVLRYAKAMAEASLGVPVDRAVITVPANFNDVQRAATKVAGKLAGLDVLRILNEPTAAALAYGQSFTDPQGRTGAPNERIAIYDLGGGTFDITVLDLSGSVFEVIATAGDTSLGGDDFDRVIVDRMVDELLRKHHYDVRNDPIAFGTLRIIAESMKRELSSRDESTVELHDIVKGEGGAAVPFSFKLTRTELEWATLALVDRTFTVCQTAVDRANITVDQLDRVILVGGASRMPLVRRRVEQFFHQPPIARVNPDEVVALGAAIQANALDREARRRTNKPISVQPPVISDESILRSSIQPAPQLGATDVAGAARAKIPSLPPTPGAGRTPSEPPIALGMDDLEEALPAPPPRAPLALDPLIAPSLPGPTQAPGGGPPPPPLRRPPAPPVPIVTAAQSPAARPRSPLLIDVTPLSLAVETVGGFCDTLIDSNTPVPCDRTRTFLTASDNQVAVFIRVAQGESKVFAENTFLGELELSGLTPARRGEVQIAVTFEIDADGILNVRAKESKTGLETKARMHVFGAQTEEHELVKMRERQARHALG
jgi:molecular chaperone DnaK